MTFISFQVIMDNVFSIAIRRHRNNKVSQDFHIVDLVVEVVKAIAFKNTIFYQNRAAFVYRPPTVGDDDILIMELFFF